MYRFFISICFLFVFASGFSQDIEEEIIDIAKDTIVYKSAYGLRVGLDVSKPILSALSDTYTGFEIVGDYRISKRFFIAAEVGFEEETTIEDYTNSTAKGNYARLGLNFNAYDNWLDMSNEISVGYRYGFSLFDQTLNSFTPNVNNIYFPSNTITTPLTTTGLNIHWSEFIIALKAETLKNLFVSFSLSYKVLMSVKDPENFKTLYAPGFNRIFDSNSGFGFNYTISYTIPFIKK